jgi:1,4-alpha-glucan branching enzyme
MKKTLDGPRYKCIGTARFECGSLVQRRIPVDGRLEAAREAASANARKSAAIRRALERVTFDWCFPTAKSVFMAGTFNDWNPTATPLRHCGNGRWMLDIELKPGRYEYRFVVDDLWADDPSIPGPKPGNHNSILIVTADPRWERAAFLTQPE